MYSVILIVSRFTAITLIDVNFGEGVEDDKTHL